MTSTPDGQAARGDDALSRIAAWAAPRGLALRHDGATGMGAVFSPCGLWRYLLWRLPPRGGKLLGAGLLNPSTADEAHDDPTIRQCRARARRAGLAGVLVWNLFAWRAALPRDLKRAADPVGPDNDAAIRLALALSARTLVGWGNHGRHMGRDQAVLRLCAEGGAGLHVLGITGSAAPRHPLYLARNVRMRPWRQSGNDLAGNDLAGNDLDLRPAGN